MSKHYSRLAIVGNGFDLAHGFETKYEDFVKHYGENRFGRFKALFEQYRPSTDEEIQWNEFERSIFSATNEMIRQDMEKCGSCDKALRIINAEFEEIRKLLAEYLRREQSSKSVKPIPSVAEFLTSDCLALNFNYTGIAANYPCHIVSVHGSLTDDDIILGFDALDPFCISNYEQRKWEKESLRRLRAFKRFLSEHEGIVPGDARYDALYNGMLRIEEMAHSNKGFDLEEIQTWPNEAIYREFWSNSGIFGKYNGLAPLADSWATVTELVVAGHSLKADQQYLAQVFEPLVNLKSCTLFCHNASKVEEKKELLLRLCHRLLLEDIHVQAYEE